MRLLVLGAGATGGYFGGRLARAGVDVTFLVRRQRREQLRRDGLRIDSPIGNLTIPVKTVEASELRADYDLVLLTCKAYDLDSAIDAIAPAMDGASVVLPMLNGMAHLERLDARFGRASVMGGACAISAMLTPDGAIRHMTPMQRLAFGERDRSSTARAQEFADALALTTIEWELAADIEQNMWEKIVFLSALAATTCLFRASVGEILAAPGGREAMTRTLDANIAIAAAEGHAPRESATAFARGVLGDVSSMLSASMRRDLEGGGPIESDHIVGWMLDRARAHGVDDTMLSLAYTHLAAHEHRRAIAPPTRTPRAAGAVRPS